MTTSAAITIEDSIVPLPADLRARIAVITPDQLAGFTDAWFASMYERSDMVRLADEVDVLRCDRATFAAVLRSAKTYSDLDFMTLASAIRLQPGKEGGHG